MLHLPVRTTTLSHRPLLASLPVAPPPSQTVRQDQVAIKLARKAFSSDGPMLPKC